MKNKIVLWGTNDQDERVLIAMELKPHDNKVEIMTFPESIATEDFSQRMMDEWRDGKPFELPEGHTLIERELTVADSILPDHLRVERSDIIQRAQTEWHFTVLSVKLHETYKSELSDLKEQIEKLTDFDSGAWDSLKNFWDKVQNQVRDRNLFRDQADALRDSANELFGKLKELRGRLDQDFKVKSKENFDRFQTMIEDVESRAAKGLRLQPLFEELKQMQHKFKELEFTRDDRNKLWSRIDEAFKKIKGKRSGGGGPGGSGGDDNPGERLHRRYEGLMSAIDRMQQSVKRDQDELNFQSRKIASTDGQLEAQIRQAKIKMVEERLRSKEEKLKEMLSTQIDLERRLQSQAERDAKREKIEEAKRAAEQKIREEIALAAQARGDDAEKLEKAAEAIQKVKGKKGESFLGAVGSVLGEALQDALDTAKAVAEVAGDQIGEAIQEAKKEAGELGDKMKEKAEDLKEKAEEIGEDMKEKAEKLGDKMKDKAEDLKEKAEEIGEDIKEKAEELGDKVKEKAKDLKSKAQEIGEEIKEKAEHLKEDALPVHEDPASTGEPETGIEAQDVAPSSPEELFSDEEVSEEEK
jgi:chromosome segregation ATPase